MFQGIIRNLNVVVFLVLWPQALQNVESNLWRRLIHLNGSKPPFQGRIGFDMLLVLVQGSRPDRLQFATGQGRLQNVGSIDGPLGPTGTDQGVQFINEEDDVPIILDLLNNLLQPVFKFTTVLSASNQGAHVEDHQPLVGQLFWNGPRDHPLGQSLDDRCLTNPGFPDQDGVVLRPSTQDLDNPLDLLVPADNRIEALGPGELRHVTGKLVQGWGSRRLVIVTVLAGTAPDLTLGNTEPPQCYLPDLTRQDVQAVQNPRRKDSFVRDQGQQQVLGPNLQGMHLLSLPSGQCQNLLSFR